MCVKTTMYAHLSFDFAICACRKRSLARFCGENQKWICSRTMKLVDGGGSRSSSALT